MSKIIASAAIRGAHACMERAETMLVEAIERHGRDERRGRRAACARPAGAQHPGLYGLAFERRDHGRATTRSLLHLRRRGG